MKSTLLAIACVLLSMRCTAPAQASAPKPSQGTALPSAGPSQAQLCALPEGPLPVVVRATFHLLDLCAIDEAAETFEFSGVLTLTWRDARQAFDPVREGVDEKLYHGAYQFNELSPGWYPQVVLANSSGTYEKQGTLLRLKPDGTSILIETVNAVARSRLDLRRYPFDRQRLEAVFAILGFDTKEVVLELEEGAAFVDHLSMRVPQWRFTKIGASPHSVAAPYAGANAAASAFKLGLDVQRQSFFILRLVVLPLMFVVILSWAVFWMDRVSLGDRMSVSFVGILTAVAYQMVVSGILPHISYVTWINAFLNFSFWTMGASVVVNLVVGKADHPRGDRIDRRCRRIFPLVYFSLILFSLVVALFWL